MSQTVMCPECSRKLKVPDPVLGRGVRCPSCKTTFTANAALKEPPPTPAVTAAPSKARPPALKAARRDDKHDVEDDTPQRRRRRAALKKRSKARLRIAVAVGGGGLLLVAIIVGIGWLVSRSSSRQAEPVVHAPPRDGPAQEKQKRLKEIKEAIQDLLAPQKDGKKPNDKTSQSDTTELEADLKPFFGELGAAMRSQDGMRIASHFDVDRIFDELVAQSAMPQKLIADKTKIMASMRQELGPALAKQAAQLAWTASTLKSVKKIGPSEVVVIVRHRDGEVPGMKMRWWVIKKNGVCKVFDYEDLDGGLRMTAGTGAVLASTDGPDMQLQQKAIAELHDAAVAISVSQNVELADQKLRGIASVKLPKVFDANRLVLTAVVRIRQGEFDAVLKVCDQAHALRADMPIIDLLKGKACNCLGKWDEALKHIEAYRAFG